MRSSLNKHLGNGMDICNDTDARSLSCDQFSRSPEWLLAICSQYRVHATACHAKLLQKLLAIFYFAWKKTKAKTKKKEDICEYIDDE